MSLYIPVFIPVNIKVNDWIFISRLMYSFKTIFRGFSEF